MNTAPNKVRAGSLPPLQLHRVMPAQFANEDPQVETVEQYEREALDVTEAVYLAAAVAIASACVGVGYVAGRFF